MLVVEPARDSDVVNVVRLAGSALGVDPSTWHMQAPCCMVARDVDHNRIVGFALADRDAPCEGHLLALAVDSERRGQGLGGALLERVRHQMRTEGALRLSLDVRADNQDAMAFYRRHGFAPEGLQPDAYPDGEGAVHLSRPL